MWIPVHPPSVIQAEVTVAEMFPALTVPKTLVPASPGSGSCVVWFQNVVCLYIAGDHEMISGGT